MGVYANKGIRFTDKEGETISIVGDWTSTWKHR